MSTYSGFNYILDLQRFLPHQPYPNNKQDTTPTLGSHSSKVWFSAYICWHWLNMTSVWMHVDRKFDIGGSNLNCTCFIVHNMIDKNDIYLTQVVSVVENIFRPTFWAFWTHPAFTSRSLFPWLGLWTDFFQIIAINRYFFHQKSLFCLKGFFFWKFSIVNNIFLQWKMFLKNSSISSCFAS